MERDLDTEKLDFHLHNLSEFVLRQVSTLMSANAARHKKLREPSHHAQDGSGSVNNGVPGREQSPVEENELKVNGLARNSEDGREPTVQAQVILQIQQQQQPQGSMVCWERFLHLRTLKVLLVENDDSTRQLVTALLRNCSYEGQ